MNRRTALQVLGAMALGYVALGAEEPDEGYDFSKGVRGKYVRSPALVTVRTYWGGGDDLELWKMVLGSMGDILEQNPGWLVLGEMTVEVSFQPMVLRDGDQANWRTRAMEPLSREADLSRLDEVARELRDERWFEPYSEGGVVFSPSDPNGVAVTFKLMPGEGAEELKGPAVRYAARNTIDELTGQLEGDLSGETVDEHDRMIGALG